MVTEFSASGAEIVTILFAFTACPVVSTAGESPSLSHNILVDYGQNTITSFQSYVFLEG